MKEFLRVLACLTVALGGLILALGCLISMIHGNETEAAHRGVFIILTLILLDRFEREESPENGQELK